MNMRRFSSKVFLASTALLASPLLASAQAIGERGTISGILGIVLRIMEGIVPIIFALAFLFFLYGVVEYVTTAGEDKKKATERIVGGLVALFVMFSVYSLIAIVRQTFLLNEATSLPVPPLPR